MRALAEINAANNTAIRDARLRKEGEARFANATIQQAERDIIKCERDIARAERNLHAHEDAGRTTLAGQTKAHIHAVKMEIVFLKRVMQYVAKELGDE